MAFSFVHAADLHLDCPFDGMGDVPPEIAHTMKEATFTAWKNTVGLCIDSDAAFLVIAGDVYNAKDKSLRAQLRFRDGAARLAEAGIPSYVVFGNHDPANGWSASLDWPEECHIFSSKTVQTQPVVKDGSQIASVSGISYPKRDVHENLSALFQAPDGSPFSIALLHCSCGLGAGHEPYASCTPSELSGKSFDYWALGHIHTRALLQDHAPVIAYPGNPQGLNPKETGPRGCYLVHVGDSGSVHIEFRETDCVRWYHERIPADGIAREQDLITAMRSRMDEIGSASGRPVLIRFEITGRSSLHRSLARPSMIQDIVNDLRGSTDPQGHLIWVESVRSSVRPAVDLAERRKAGDFVGDFLKAVQAVREDPAAIEHLRSMLAPLFEDSRAHRYLPPPTDEQILAWLDAAETRAFDALAGEEG